MKYKICTKCRNNYPATLKHFSPEKRVKDSLTAQCRKCRKEYSATKENKMYKKEYQKKYRQTLNGYIQHVFHHIKDRCNNPNCKSFKDYGGRGIKCLFKSSDEFIGYIINELQIDPRGLTIDRIDNDGDYEKGNIRFVTRIENNRNKIRKLLS